MGEATMKGEDTRGEHAVRGICKNGRQSQTQEERMKREKGLKVAILMLGISMCVSFATFAQSKVTKVTFWTWSNTKTLQWVWDRYVADNPQYKDVQFEAHSTGGQAVDMMKNILVSYAAGAEIPDVVEMNFKLNSMLVANDIAADVTAYVQPYASMLPPEVLKSAQHNGKIYGFPLRGNSTMMLYRKDILEKAGVKPADLTTWAGFLAAGKKVTRNNKPNSDSNVYMLNVGPKTPGYVWGETFLGMHDLGFFDGSGNEIVDKDPGAIESFRLIDQFVKSGIATLVDDFTPQWYAALKDGKIATLVEAGWMPSILAQNVPDGAGKWVVTGYPTFATGKQSMQGIAGYTVFTKDKAKLDLICKAMVHTFFSEPVERDFEKDIAFNASLSFLAKTPPATPLLESFYPGQNIKKLDTDLLNQAVLFHYTPAFQAGYDILNTELSKTVTGQISIDDAIKAMGKDFQQKVGTSTF
jgi:lactose/L-arabinose transport system substrate-binding protein